VIAKVYITTIALPNIEDAVFLRWDLGGECVANEGRRLMRLNWEVMREKLRMSPHGLNFGGDCIAEAAIFFIRLTGR